MSIGGSAGGAAGQAFMAWLLRKRRPEAERGPDGASWILRYPALLSKIVPVLLVFFVALTVLMPVALLSDEEEKVGAGVVVFATAIPLVFVLLTLYGWVEVIRERVVLDDGGLTFHRAILGPVSIRWTDLDRLHPGMGEKMTLFDREGHRAKISKYLNGLGRLRAELLSRRPDLMVPARTFRIMIHPLEWLPPLPGSERPPGWNVPELLPGQIPGHESFAFEVEEATVSARYGHPRTQVTGTVVRGEVTQGDVILPPREFEPTEGTFVLVLLAGFGGGRRSAREGDRVSLFLFGVPLRWARPGVQLTGGPLPGGPRTGA